MNNYYQIDQLPGRTLRLDGQEYLFFSGTSYLGMAKNPDFLALLNEAQGRYGSVFGSSRNGNLRLSVFEEAEVRLAAFAGAEAALTLSSGMLAGQAVVNWLKSEGYGFLYGPNAHPAIWHEPTPGLPNLSFGEWSARLPDLLRAATGPVVVAVNSLDAMRSIGYSFDWVNQLPADREITLLVDDSHGLGVIGPGGSGIRPAIPDRANVRLIVTASLAKAMGIPGGVIFSDADCLAAIRRTPFFGACSPIPPAYLAAFGRAGELYRQAHSHLLAAVRRTQELLAGPTLFRQLPDYPVFYTADPALYPFLLQRNILIYSFAYPSPEDEPNTRLVINALHETDDLIRLAGAVREFADAGKEA